jgi:hypothetical protein
MDLLREYPFGVNKRTGKLLCASPYLRPLNLIIGSPFSGRSAILQNYATTKCYEPHLRLYLDPYGSTLNSPVFGRSDGEADRPGGRRLFWAQADA